MSRGGVMFAIGGVSVVSVGEAWTCTSRLWCVRDSVNDVTMGTISARKKPPDTEAILYFFTHDVSNPFPAELHAHVQHVHASSCSVCVVCFSLFMWVLFFFDRRARRLAGRQSRAEN